MVGISRGRRAAPPHSGSRLPHSFHSGTRRRATHRHSTGSRHKHTGRRMGRRRRASPGPPTSTSRRSGTGCTCTPACTGTSPSGRLPIHPTLPKRSTRASRRSGTGCTCTPACTGTSPSGRLPIHPTLPKRSTRASHRSGTDCTCTPACTGTSPSAQPVPGSCRPRRCRAGKGRSACTTEPRHRRPGRMPPAVRLVRPLLVRNGSQHRRRPARTDTPKESVASPREIQARTRSNTSFSTFLRIEPFEIQFRNKSHSVCGKWEHPCQHRTRLHGAQNAEKSDRTAAEGHPVRLKSLAF